MDDVVSQMKGSKPFRIDTHYHIFPPKFMANQAKRNPKAYDPRQVVPATIDLKDWTPGFAVEELDRGGIAVGIAQMIAAPGIWFGDVAAARDLAREWNEYAAQMGRDFPGRFGTLAVLPLPDVDSALREIEYALDTLHADGVQIMSHYDGRYPADPRFRPVLEELNRRKAVVFVHPFLPPSHNVLPTVRPATIEFPFDTTRAIVSLVLSGTTSQLSDIRFIFTHGGGALPSLAGRVEELTKDDKDRAARIPNGIASEFRNLYYEIANAYHRPAFAGLRELAPASHILFGTDYPYLSVAAHAQGLEKAEPSVSKRTAIERDNALPLFPRFAKAIV
jgi:6-methylsalicylate decarboxylase